jgi:hypothetical protein
VRQRSALRITRSASMAEPKTGKTMKKLPTLKHLDEAHA